MTNVEFWVKLQTKSAFPGKVLLIELIRVNNLFLDYLQFKIGHIQASPLDFF